MTQVYRDTQLCSRYICSSPGSPQVFMRHSMGWESFGPRDQAGKRAVLVSHEPVGVPCRTRQSMQVESWDWPISSTRALVADDQNRRTSPAIDPIMAQSQEGRYPLRK